MSRGRGGRLPRGRSDVHAPRSSSEIFTLRGPGGVVIPPIVPRRRPMPPRRRPTRGFRSSAHGNRSGAMRRNGLGLLLVACGLAACGGSTQTKTVTVTKTVTAPASTQAQAPTTPAPATSTPTTSTGAEGATPAQPLPAGVAAADGTYRMRFRNSDYTGENIVVSEGEPDPADWKFATTCQ